MGCYIIPDDTLTIEDVVAAISKRPRKAELLVAGNFNVDLAEPEGNARDEKIAAALGAARLEDMSTHFLPRHKPWLRDGRTWSMLRGGREVRSQTNCLLGTDCRLLQNVLLRDVCHNIDHYLVLGCLRRAAATERSR